MGPVSGILAAEIPAADADATHTGTPFVHGAPSPCAPTLAYAAQHGPLAAAVRADTAPSPLDQQIGSDPGGIGSAPGGVESDPGGIGSDPGGIGSGPGGIGLDPGGIGSNPGRDAYSRFFGSAFAYRLAVVDTLPKPPSKIAEHARRDRDFATLSPPAKPCCGPVD